MIRENFYKLFIAIHAILLSIFLVSSPALADDTVTSDREDIDFSKIYDANIYMPHLTNFYYSAGTTYCYSGSNPMIVYRVGILDRYRVYTGGNLVFSNMAESSKAHPWAVDSYFFDDTGRLFLNHNRFKTDSNLASDFKNAYVLDQYVNDVEAGQYALNFKEELKDAQFREEHSIIDTYQYLSWSSDGRFNPFIDGTESEDNRNYITINIDAGTYKIPSCSGIYMDYILDGASNHSCAGYSLHRAYYYGLTAGTYNENDIEALLPHKSSSSDNVCLIGIGSFVINESVKKGVNDAPNLLDKNVTSWNYTRLNHTSFAINESEDINPFENGIKSKNTFNGTYNVTASTTGDDINDNTGDDAPIGGGTGTGSGSHSFSPWLGSGGFNGIYNYIISVQNDITNFNRVIEIVFSWMPDGVYTLIVAVLGAFVTILFIKIILHLL